MKRNQDKVRRRMAAAVLTLAVAIATPGLAAETITRQAAAEELKAIPLYAVLEKHYPATYNLMLDSLVEGLNKGRPFKTITADLNSFVVKLVAEQTPKANVENTLGLLRLTRDQAKAALTHDPADCLSLLGARPHDLNAVRALPEDLTQRDLAMTAKVLEQTAVSPQPFAAPFDPKRLESIAIDAYDRLPDDRLRAAFREIGGDPSKANDPLSQTAYCEFGVAMFDIILSMPPIEGAQTFRAISAMD